MTAVAADAVNDAIGLGMRSAHRVVVVISNEMSIFEVAIPCEIFGIDRSYLASPWYRFSVVGVGEGSVRMAPGFVLACAQGDHDLEQADTLIVPPAANEYNPPAELVEVVRVAYERGTRIVSICTGAFVLAAAGVLDGRRAATHWMCAEDLARRYPAVRVDPAVLYVEDNNVITSAGTAAGIDACLHVVRTDHGAAIAAELARHMVMPPYRQGGQAQYCHLPAPPVADDWLAPLLDWIGEHLHLPLATADLASQASVSGRTLERRFAAILGMSPLQWLLEQRVRRAQQLLETTDSPVDWIATLSGFGTPASLRAHFARIVGVPPTAYRRTFRDSARPSQIAS